MAKKGGDCLGFSGHKHMVSEKIVALSDRNCNVISPMTIAPGKLSKPKVPVKKITKKTKTKKEATVEKKTLWQKLRVFGSRAHNP